MSDVVPEASYIAPAAGAYWLEIRVDGRVLFRVPRENVGDGVTHEVLFWDYQSETIWGATARILKHYLDLLEGV